MKSSTHLLVATSSPHKTAEIRAILGSNWQIDDLRTLPTRLQAEETGETFEANARLKALAASLQTDRLVLADDSGLETDALDGMPGVRSARFAGPDADDAANRERLLRELHASGVPPERWTARFRCAIAVARCGVVLGTCHGMVEGRLVERERGTGGFGYDPLFVPFGFEQTFAELAPETKNRLSHRARALQAARELLEALADG